ncbi:hypothetical protein C8R45DRAFT_1125204 [Mycena sanguinolenta]|nr:hypothetical protein C8R45DRAFT_1125204 [Mycena sanguinolenta]
MHIHAYEKRISICTPPNPAPPPGIESSPAQAKTRPGPAVRAKCCGANEEKKAYYPEPEPKTPRREPQPRAQATLGQPRKQGARKAKERKIRTKKITQRNAPPHCSAYTAIRTPTPTHILPLCGTCHAARGADNMYVWDTSKAKAGRKATRNPRTDGQQNRCEKRSNATQQTKPKPATKSGRNHEDEGETKTKPNHSPRPRPRPRPRVPGRIAPNNETQARKQGKKEEGDETHLPAILLTLQFGLRSLKLCFPLVAVALLRTPNTRRRRKKKKKKGGGRKEGSKNKYESTKAIHKHDMCPDDLAALHRTACRAADQDGDKAPYDYDAGSQVIPRVPAVFSLSHSLPTPAPPTLAALVLHGLGAGLSPVGAANVVPDELVPLVEVEAGGDRSELELVVRTLDAAVDAAVDADVERGEVERHAKDPVERDVDSVDLEVDREVERVEVDAEGDVDRRAIPDCLAPAPAYEGEGRQSPRKRYNAGTRADAGARGRLGGGWRRHSLSGCHVVFSLSQSRAPRNPNV